MLPVAAILLLRGLMISAVSVYLPTFLTEEGASLILAGSSLSVYQAAGTVGALLGGSLSDRLGRRQVLALSLLLTPLGMLVFLATGGAWRILSLLVVGAGSLACLPVLMAVVQEGFPENRALANGLYQALNFVGTAVLSLGVGFLGDLLGLRMAFTVSTFVALLAVPLVLLLPLGAKSRQPVRP